MAATRVSGVTTSVSVSGTLYAIIGGVGDYHTQPESPTGFGSCGVSIPGASVGIGISDTFLVLQSGSSLLIENPMVSGSPLDPSDPAYSEVVAVVGSAQGTTYVWQYSVTASAGWEGEPPASSNRYYVAYNVGESGGPAGGEEEDPPPAGVGWLGEDELSLSYSLTLSGYQLKRTYETSVPTARSHMHLTDASCSDEWYVTPDASATASIDGLSVTGYRRDAYDPGTPDADIGDELTFGPSASYGMSVNGPVLGTGDPICSVSCSAADFTGLNHTACTSDTPTKIMAVGSGSTASLVSTGVIGTGSWSGFSVVPWSYSWLPEFELWEGEDLDPDLWAGFYSAKVIEYEVGGITYQTWGVDEALMYAASELPSGESSSWQSWGGYGVGTPGATPSPRWWNYTFSATIDEFWALNNWLCPERVNYEGGGEDAFLIETMQDRYVPVHVPGVDGGCSAPYQAAVMTILTQECSLIPPAADKDNPAEDPLDRLEQIGTLADYHSPTVYTEPPPPRTPTTALQWQVPEYGVYFDGPRDPGETPKPGPFPSGGVGLAPQTRYWERLALIPQLESGTPPTAVPKDWRWYWHLGHRAAGEDVVSDGDPREPSYAEDPFSWRGMWLKIDLFKPCSAEFTLTLTVTYREAPTVYDPHYTCGSYRAEEFEYSVPASQTVTYTVPVPTAPEADPWYAPTHYAQRPFKLYHSAEVVVDLLRPDDGSVPDLWVVDSWSLDGLTIPFDSYTDPINGALVWQGGYLEIEDIQLCNDQGYDHTGRDVREDGSEAFGSRLGIKCGESWDFQGDWAFQWGSRDGFPYIYRIPDDPYRNNGPEDGLGCIEPLEHCPTYTGSASQMDYARPLDTAGQLWLQEGYTAEQNTAAINGATKSFWKGEEDPETLCGLLQYHLTGRMLTAGDGEVDLTAAIVCNSWALSNAVPCTIHLRKTMGGSAQTLLITDDGKRFTWYDLSDLEGPIGTTFSPALVIWKKVSYVDEEDNPIEWPGGDLPTPDVYEVYSSGAPNLDRHGLLQFPGLYPTKTRINNPTKSQEDASLQTDRGVTSYYAQLWATSGWQAYDVNDYESLQLMLADKFMLCELGTVGEVAPRMITVIPPKTVTPPNISEHTRIDAVESPFGTVLVAHHSDIYWAGQAAPQFDNVLQLDSYSRFGDATDGPATMLSVGEYDNPVLFGKCHESVAVISPSELLMLAAEDYQDPTASIFKAKATGAKVSLSADTFENARYYASVRSPHTSDVMMAYRNPDTEKVNVVRYTLTSPADGGGGLDWSGTWEWLYLTQGVADCDEMSPALAVNHMGSAVLLTPSGDNIIPYRSDDFFRTFTATGDNLSGYTHPACTLESGTQAMLVLVRNTETGKAVLYRYAPWFGNTGDNAWYQLSDSFGDPVDEVTGAVVSLPTGRDLVFVVRDSQIHVYESLDGWRTVTAL